ncbi:MAG: cytochrome c oxidase subunit II [Gemmataceae bacterium]
MMNTDFVLLPEQASTMAPRVDGLFWFIVGICVFFGLLIAAMLLLFAVRYRRVREDYVPTPIHGSTPLELFWTGVPLIIVMIVFFWGAAVYFDIMRTPENALEVYVTGKQWMWHLQHPGGQREINTLHIPLGRPIKLIMTSEDVIHDFAVPAFRVKMDAVPGKYTYSWFEATKPGTYHLFCVLYCGTDHARMIGKVVVMQPEEYEQWLTERADRSLALQGRQLFQKLQCVTCHHPEANNRAPILENIFGKRVALENGRTALADESYLRESILYPANKVRAGWRPIMPTYKEQVNEDDLIRLVAYLKSLKTGETPSRVEHADPPAVEEAPAKPKEKDKAPEKEKTPDKDKGAKPVDKK